FILADAKDADMAFGLDAPGTDPLTGARRSLADYRDQIREIVSQGLVDIMLMSASTSELLTVEERLFDGTTVTPAVRANDTTDIHMLAGAAYPQQPSRPFRTATIEQIKRAAGVDVGLYSLTPANDAVVDVAALEAYRAFRIEAEREGFRHFLEVFAPNPVAGAPAALFGRKIKDSEHPLTFIRHLRALADGQIDAGEACRAYHSDLRTLGITPRRSSAIARSRAAISGGSGLPREEAPRVLDHHLVDVGLRRAGGQQLRHHRPGDQQIVGLLVGEGRVPGEEVHEAGGVVGEVDAVAVALVEEREQRTDPLGGWVEVVDPEAV